MKQPATRIYFTVTLLLIMSLSLLRASILPETDILWGAVNGNDILRDGVKIFLPDTWNVTTLGDTWSPNSWLWNVTLAAFFNTFGVAGFFWLTALNTALSFTLLWAVLKKINVPDFWQILIIVGSWVILSPWMNGRSNSIDVLIIVLFLYVTVYIRGKVESFRWNSVFLIASAFGIVVLWINMHLTAVIAVALFPTLVYAVYWEEKKKSWLYAAMTGVATVAGLGVSPFGYEALLKVSQVQNESADFFIEWSHVFSSGEPNWTVILCLLAGLSIAGFALYRKQFLYAAAVITLVVMSYNTIRFTPFLFILIIPGLLLIRKWVQLPKIYKLLPVMILSTVLVATIVRVIPVAEDPYNILPTDPRTFSSIPEGSVVASVSESAATMILYRPDVLVTIDGRNDLMGKERYSESYNMMLEPDAQILKQWLETCSVNVVYIPVNLLQEEAGNIIRNMEQLKWQRIHEDEETVIYSNKQPPNQPTSKCR